MRAVVDTNVLVSAILKDQSLPALAVHIIEQRGVLLKSAATERQLLDVLARPYFVPLVTPAAHAWLKKLLAAAEAVAITERIVACRDPTDDKFLELAINGHADLIVSGDADLLALNPFRDIPIVPPALFVQSVAR
jgi:putative PIN family toxin of toxin-antitoxin system